MSRVRVGVLGAASIAWRRTLPAMLEVPELELVAVASRELARAEKFAAEFSCAAVGSYEELLGRDDIDAVYVPLPTGLHHEWVARALLAGKHVLAEKPLTTCAALARELLALAEERGLLLRENFMFLHHGQHEAVRALLRDGEIGELRSVHAVFGIPPLPADDVRMRPELGGGALLDVGVYPVRFAQYLLGEDLEVLGSTLRHDPASGVDVGGEALLRSASGVTAHLSFGFDRGYRNAYELWGSEGRLVLDRVFTPPPALAPVVEIECHGATRAVTLQPDHQFRNILAAFAADVLAGATPSDREAAGAVNATAAIVRQAALVDEIRSGGKP